MLRTNITAAAAGVSVGTPPVTNPGDATIIASDPGGLSVSDVVNFIIQDTAPPDTPRNVFYSLDFETGAFQQRASIGGVPVHDGAACQSFLNTGPTIDIASIANNIVLDPDKAIRVTTIIAHGLDDDSGGPAPEGITINGVTGSLGALLNGKLWRVRNATATEFDLYFDHFIPGYMDDGQGAETGQSDLGANILRTQGDDYSGPGTVETWAWAQTTGNNERGPGTNYDTKVEPSILVGVETVLPRNGNFFLSSYNYYDKPYNHFGGNSGKNKSRFIVPFPSEVLSMDWLSEVWYGFSVYIPLNWDDETTFTSNSAEVGFSSCNSSGVGSGLYKLRIAHPNGSGTYGGLPGGQAQWLIAREASSTAIDGVQTWSALGDLSDDKGLWTDYVIRYRINPFTAATNPFDAGITGGANQTFPANAGIFQLWKSEGPIIGAPGDPLYRNMVLKMDDVNTPVGCVPEEGAAVRPDIRFYRFGWHHFNTDVPGPYWIGHDQTYAGRADVEGTGYSDVHATQQAQP